MSYRSSGDGYEFRENETIIDNEYKKYLKWIEDIKTMCDENHLVSKAADEELEFEDDIYYDPEYDQNTMDHYLLDNGLHVYMKDGVVRIQDVEGIDYSKPQRCMELKDDNISFYLGAEGPECPYLINYDAENNMFAKLPFTGLISEQSNIRDILESGVNYYNYYIEKFKDKSEEMPPFKIDLKGPDVLYAWMGPSKGIELFKSSTELYDKIYDIVKTFQQQKSNSKSSLQLKKEERDSLRETDQKYTEKLDKLNQKKGEQR